MDKMFLPRTRALVASEGILPPAWSHVRSDHLRNGSYEDSYRLMVERISSVSKVIGIPYAYEYLAVIVHDHIVGPFSD